MSASTVSAAAAAYIAATVESANLDDQPVEIVGEYLTVSAVSSWLIQEDDGDTITVKLGRIGGEQARGPRSEIGSASMRS